MSQHRQFEGPDVRVLLDEIRDAYGGTEPTIAKAETYRSGGVLGFFQKECYRLTVDDESASVRPAPAEPANRTSPSPLGGSDDPVAADLFEESDLFTLLAESTLDDNLVTTGSAAVAVTDEPQPALTIANEPEITAFDSILERVASVVDAPGASERRERVAVAAGWETPMAALAAVAPDATTTLAQTPSPAPEPAPWLPTPITRSTEASEAPKARTSSPMPDGPPADNAAAVDGVSSRPITSMAARSTTPRTAVRDTTLRRALTQSGLDPDIVGRVVDEVKGGRELTTALTEALLGLPSAPPLPRGQGALIVVAGSSGTAAPVAAEIARQIGTDPGEVLLASVDAPSHSIRSDRRMRSPEDAACVAPGYRRKRAAVVAVDVGLGTGAENWADDVITALRPTMVLGVVDALHKTEDVAAWIIAIGGVDAIVIDNPQATTSPAAALALELPVARLAGQPASAARWAATILDRINQCG